MKNSQNSKCSFLNHSVFILFALLLSITGNVHASQFKNTLQLFDRQDKQNTKDSVFIFVEKMPQFPGGEKEVIRFLSHTMSYPEEAQKKDEHGKVIVQFVISKTGKVEKAKVLRGVSPELDSEALRVVSLLPDWIPGEQNGEKVSVYRIIPILFQKISSEDAWEVNEKTVVMIDNVKMPSNFNLNVLNREKIDTMYLLKPFPERAKNKLIEQYGQEAENGVILFKTKKDITYKNTNSKTCLPGDENYIYKDVDKMPEFPGGEYKLLNYISHTLQYPDVAQVNKIQGKVIVQFVVDKTGKVKDAIVIKGVDSSLDNESIRVLNTLPNFEPGEKGGKKVNVYYILPMTFRLEGEDVSSLVNGKSIIIIDGQRMPADFNKALINIRYLKSYQVLIPVTKEIKKHLIEQYGADGANGVILIVSNK